MTPQTLKAVEKACHTRISTNALHKVNYFVFWCLALFYLLSLNLWAVFWVWLICSINCALIAMFRNHQVETVQARLKVLCINAPTPEDHKEIAQLRVQILMANW